MGIPYNIGTTYANHYGWRKAGCRAGVARDASLAATCRGLAAIARCAVFASGFAFAVAGFAGGANAAGSIAAVVSHKAFYELGLQHSHSDSNVAAVSGKAAYSVKRDCGGWLSFDSVKIEYLLKDTPSYAVASSVESWEDFGGETFSFERIRNTSDGERTHITGYMHREADAGRYAYFSSEPDDRIVLPPDTLLPIEYLTSVLHSAQRGERQLVTNLFSGGEREDALMLASTFISGWHDEPETNLGALGESGFWRVKTAYFLPTGFGEESEATTPEYEIELDLQNNGLVRSYAVNYGDFSLDGVLVTAETIDSAVCG